MQHIRCAVMICLVHYGSGLLVQAQSSGNYSAVRPPACKPLPDVIYTSTDFNGPIPTNQWWSSLVWEKHSQNMFPHPMGVVFCEAGLSVAYPGAAMVSNANSIMGGGVSSNGDIVIGHSTIDKFESTRLDTHSQWFITALQRAGDSSLRMTLGHGCPFVFCRITGGNPELKFPHVPDVFLKLSESAVGITVRGNHYGVFGGQGSRWSGVGTTSLINRGNRGYFSIALLPDNNEQTLRRFANCAHNHVVGSKAEYRVENGNLITDYRFQLEQLESVPTDATLFATYPHQWKYITTPLTDLSYKSVRGAMKIGSGKSFTTQVPLQGVLPILPAHSSTDKKRLVGYLQAEASREKSMLADTYWDGKHLGKLATLAGIAEVIGETRLEKRFVGEMRKRLENWFTASPGEEEGLFFYDRNWGTLIGCPASYGSDAELNDHHFHYGYFIRAAAEVARRDRGWAKKWGKMVDLLVRDIASTLPEDELFPRLRCFDVYAGHSWASGHAKFGDGNNQESSSEAINAWYGLMLWGEVSGNPEVRDAGVYLFNTERVAVEEYWFDVSEKNFPTDFTNVALGMVWGGKGAFATWFSADIDCIHGINWLPFTPASIYMGRHPDYVKKNFDRITQERKFGDDYNTGWGDLLVMFGGLQNPSIGLRHLAENPECKIEQGNTRAFMYHWLRTMSSYGKNRSDISSNYPFVNVYIKDGTTTYAVFNFDESPMPVEFSDGTQVLAEPGRLTLSRSRAKNP